MSPSDERPPVSSPLGDGGVPVKIETSFVEERAERASLLQLFSVLLRYRRIVLGLPIALAVVVCTVVLLLPRQYSVNASFVPSESGAAQAGRLQGLAAQFGFSLPGGAQAESPEFYAQLLRSGPVLRAAVRTPYRVSLERSPETSWMEGDLIDLLGIDDADSGRRLEKGIEALEKRMSVRTRPETGTVLLSVRTRWPELSVQITNRLLELVNEFNLETRQSQASKEREFLIARVEEARAELEAAEDSLRQFLEQNRRIDNDPRLVFERDRLDRKVGLQRDVYTALTRSLEQAKIEEVRNTPVITIVEESYPPTRADRRGLLVKGILSVATGLLLGIVLAFALEFGRLAREREPDRFVEFQQLSAEAIGDVERLWRRVRRASSQKV